MESDIRTIVGIDVGTIVGTIDSGKGMGIIGKKFEREISTRGKRVGIFVDVGVVEWEIASIDKVERRQKVR